MFLYFVLSLDVIPHEVINTHAVPEPFALPPVVWGNQRYVQIHTVHIILTSLIILIYFVPSLTLYPPSDLTPHSVLQWRNDSSLLAFSPDTAQGKLRACGVLTALEIDCDSVSYFADQAALTAKWDNGYTAGISFVEDESEFTVHHVSLSNLAMGFGFAFSELNATNPRPTSEDAAVYGGYVLLQQLATEVLLREQNPSHVMPISMLVQPFPVEGSFVVNNLVNLFLPLFVLGALFASMQATLAGVGADYDTGVREVLLLKGKCVFTFC